MSASSDFFGRRSPAAVLKHGVLTRYAQYFAGRAGLATRGEVAFIDGYAGEGRYDDDSPGSPLLLASQAARVKMFDRHVKLAFVEKDDASRAKLQASLDSADVVADQVIGGGIEAAIDGLLDRYDDRAILLFVDPFGLAFSRATLEGVLAKSAPGRPIDVLYHFSLSAIARMGSQATAGGTGSMRNAEHLDDALGDVDWRGEFRRAVGARAATRAALRLAEHFGRAIEETVEVPSIGIPVRKRPDQMPKYLLMLFSANDEARWDYADHAGMAHVDWLHYCDQSDYEANLRRDDETGAMALFDVPSPERGDIDERLGQRVIPELVRHLTTLFRERGSMRPVNAVQDIYGENLGVARITHLRKALRELHSQGLIADDARGDFWQRKIH